jgi:hypothetical protein
VKLLLIGNMIYVSNLFFRMKYAALPEPIMLAQPGDAASWQQMPDQNIAKVVTWQRTGLLR